MGTYLTVRTVMKLAACLALVGGGIGVSPYTGCGESTPSIINPQSTPLPLPPVEIPQPVKFIEVPMSSRVSNYGPSCAWAVVAMMLNYHGQPAMADWIQDNKYGGSSIGNVVETLQSNGYDARYLTSVPEVEQAINLGKPVGYCCWVGTSYHARMLIGLDQSTARYIDPNSINHVYTVPRVEWLDQWFSCKEEGMVLDMPLLGEVK